MKKIGKRIIKLILFIIILICILYYFDNTNNSNNTIVSNNIDTNKELLEIYYFDVGEAESSLIKYKDHNILIDAGNTMDGKNLVNYLKEIGINHLDIVFVTHAHEDHMGGMQWIIYKLPVDIVYMPNHYAEWKSYDNLMNSIKERNVTLEEPTIDQEFTFDKVNIKLLWIDNGDNYNNNSIVLKLNYLNTSYLFMGDATSDVEHLILDKDIKSNVLKVGHHGSKDANSAVFLDKVKPDYSIISVGKNNDYHHPHDVVLNKLNTLNSTIYRTDINHTIHLISDGDNIKFDFIKTNINGGDLNS